MTAACLGLGAGLALAVCAHAAQATTRVAVADSFLPDPGVRIDVLSHPRTLHISSADSAVSLRKITWHGWGSAEATATAVGRTCSSGGPEGDVCHSGPVALTASRLVGFDGDRYYTSLIASGIPDYGPNDVPLPAKAPSFATLSTYCDSLRITSAYRTSCAVTRLVERTFADRCRAEHPSLSDPTSRCHLRVRGFDCRPTGDAYHPVHCRRRRVRVTFQLAE